MSHVEFDLGLLMASDVDQVASWKTLEQCEDVLHSLAARNAQLLFNEIFSLPTQSTTNDTMAILPPPKTHLPRSKPVPTDKPQTRWEKFADAKGIAKKKKKSRMEFNEEAQEYRPRHGYKSEGAMDDWLIEVPGNAACRQKHSRQRRNTEEAEVLKKGGNVFEHKKNSLKKEISQANVSTASIGKFNKSVKGEENIKMSKGRESLDSLVSKDEVGKVRRVADVVAKKMALGEDEVNARKLGNYQRQVK
ncbi:ribosome biogenesis regulatory protein-domain-containing protein [Chytridium lagenaria]|nr:ribosome biogenesis regulatory protein-domain-containing protein [Chytridium lagenaria]